MSQGVFQKKFDRAYKGILNGTGIAYDIIVSRNTPGRLKNYFGLTSERLQFKASSINLFGNKITSKGLKPATSKLETIILKTPNNSKDLLKTIHRACKNISNEHINNDFFD